VAVQEAERALARAHELANAERSPSIARRAFGSDAAGEIDRDLLAHFLSLPLDHPARIWDACGMSRTVPGMATPWPQPPRTRELHALCGLSTAGTYFPDDFWPATYYVLDSVDFHRRLSEVLRTGTFLTRGAPLESAIGRQLRGLPQAEATPTDEAEQNRRHAAKVFSEPFGVREPTVKHIRGDEIVTNPHSKG
jgi:hypothetical protein